MFKPYVSVVPVQSMKFRYKGERLWLNISQIHDDNVSGRVWNHHMNEGLLFGQLIDIPFKYIPGTWYEFSHMPIRCCLLVW